MTFTVPNLDDAAFAPQAQLDALDLRVIAAGHEGSGVLSGCAVTAQVTPTMSLDVAAGTISLGGTEASVTAGPVVISAAHATDPRFDLVLADSAGALSVAAGNPIPYVEGVTTPEFPSVDLSTHVVLAAVYVPANDTEINANQITDKRLLRQAVSIYEPHLDVRSRGAVLDGVADDTTPFQDSINDLPAEGGTIFVPPGLLRVTGAGVSGDQSDVILRGAGKVASDLRYEGTGTCLTWGTGASDLQARLKVEDLAIRGTASGVCGFDLLQVQNWIFSNVDIRGFSTGKAYRIRGSNSGLFLNCDARQSAVGVSGELSTWGCNLNNWIGGQLTENAVHIDIVNGGSNSFMGANIAQSTAAPCVKFQNGRKNSVRECYFEDNAAGDSVIHIGNATQFGHSTIIEANQVIENLAISYFVKVERGFGVRVMYNDEQGVTAWTAFVRLESNGQRAAILFNENTGGGTPFPWLSDASGTNMTVHLDANNIWRPVRGTAAQRPTAAAAGDGGQFYNRDTNQLNISDGTTWRDALGTAV